MDNETLLKIYSGNIVLRGPIDLIEPLVLQIVGEDGHGNPDSIHLSLTRGVSNIDMRLDDPTQIETTISVMKVVLDSIAPVVENEDTAEDNTGELMEEYHD